MKRFLAFCIVLFAASALWAQAQTAVLKDFSGKVEVMAPGGAWKPAVKGMTLAKNSSISTGFKSLAVLSLGSSTLTVKPLTKLTLEELVKAEGGDIVKLFLNTGRVSAQVSAPAGGATDFSVKSPTATASVRGTWFDFDGANLAVNEGTVVFFGSNGQAVAVSGGGSSSLGADGSALTPLESAYEELKPLLPPGMDASSFASLASVSGDFLAALAAAGVTITVSW
jgi:hypothetical protein